MNSPARRRTTASLPRCFPTCSAARSLMSPRRSRRRKRPCADARCLTGWRRTCSRSRAPVRKAGSTTRTPSRSGTLPVARRSPPGSSRRTTKARSADEPPRLGRRLHRHHDAADRPEERVLAAADVPQPLALAVAPCRPRRDEQEDGGEDGGIGRVDAENEQWRANHSRGQAADKPRLGRLQPPLLVDAKHEIEAGRLRIEMRKQKRAADDAQNVEAV